MSPIGEGTLPKPSHVHIPPHRQDQQIPIGKESKFLSKEILFFHTHSLEGIETSSGSNDSVSSPGSASCWSRVSSEISSTKEIV